MTWYMTEVMCGSKVVMAADTTSDDIEMLINIDEFNYQMDNVQQKLVTEFMIKEGMLVAEVDEDDVETVKFPVWEEMQNIPNIANLIEQE